MGCRKVHASLTPAALGEASWPPSSLPQAAPAHLDLVTNTRGNADHQVSKTITDSTKPVFSSEPGGAVGAHPPFL